MAHIRGTELETLLGAGDTALLFQYNVRHIEDLAGLLSNPLGYTLVRTLTEEEVLPAVERFVEQYIGRAHGVSLSAFNAIPATSTIPTSHGSKVPDFSLSQGFLSAPFEHEYMSEVEPPQAQQGDWGEGQGEAFDLYDGECPNPLDQGQRGTCASHTCLAMIECLQRQDPVELSPQYLHYLAKRSDGRSNEDGTNFSTLLEVLREDGVCELQFCKYNPNPDPGQGLMFKKTTYSLKHLRDRVPKAYVTNSELLPMEAVRDVRKIRSYIRSGLPVGIGVYTFAYSWTQSRSALRSGEIILPIPAKVGEGYRFTDKPTGAHAVTLIGYRDNKPGDEDGHRPGGGFFIFRNSWGSQWAFNNKYNEGYGYLPYEYVRQYGLSACLIRSVEFSGRVIE